MARSEHVNEMLPVRGEENRESCPARLIFVQRFVCKHYIIFLFAVNVLHHFVVPTGRSRRAILYVRWLIDMYARGRDY